MVLKSRFRLIKMAPFFSPPSIAVLILLTIILQPEGVSAKTIRYRQGVLDGDYLEERQLTVPEARDFCKQTPNCVAFSYSSPTRFPEGKVACFFFSISDWHVKLSGEPSFVEDAAFHTYLNTTREKELLPQEIKVIVDQYEEVDENGAVQKDTKLRGGSSSPKKSESSSSSSQADLFLAIDRKFNLLVTLFEICVTMEFRTIAAPTIAPLAVKIALSASEEEEIRLMALKLLILLGDSTETGMILIKAGVYEAMQHIIEKRDRNTEEHWDELPKTALDVLSNICLHRSANPALVQKGAGEFLKSLLSVGGFPSIQALLALTHLGGPSDAFLSNLPKQQIQDLVGLISNAIDGDVTFDIKWDLVPGPLSAIKFLIQHVRTSNGAVFDTLLDEGIIEQCLRVLESDCLQASDVLVALEILRALADASERAQHIVLMAHHQIEEANIKLREFAKAGSVANSLSSYAASMESARSEL